MLGPLGEEGGGGGGRLEEAKEGISKVGRGELEGEVVVEAEGD